ncbi:hypothetical protein IK112_03815, partial [Candidatus Saccharibacteria bacterium]|nr:hypothetical protein [Candidatus Saccharibacteria bacterium]
FLSSNLPKIRQPKPLCMPPASFCNILVLSPSIPPVPVGIRFRMYILVVTIGAEVAYTFRILMEIGIPRQPMATQMRTTYS